MKDMNWTKWASIAEIVSSVAILVTILYLAIQTEQNTDAINSQSRQSLAESAVFEQSMWLQNPELSSFIVDNSIEMSFEQKVQLDSLLIMAFTRREFAYRQYKAGILDEEVWNQEAEVIALLLGTERTRSWWRTIGKNGFESDFANTTDSIILGKPYHPYWESLVKW
ncbi:MAG: hypothetical protein JKY29_12500 [Gammaproteobacteria bacterium]|nr:hypothetical protein [Gammaproteobacteria bacterium]